jgi:multidrug resistance efflux pump
MSVTRITTILTIMIGALALVAGGFGLFADMDFHVVAHGCVEPVRVLPVRLAGTGLVEHVAAVGAVESGQPLVTLSSSSVREDLAIVRARMKMLRAEVEKEQSDLGNPQRRFSLMQSLKALELQAARLAQDLRHKEIRAPFDGEVISAHIDPGEYLAGGDRVALMVADTSRYVFTGEVSPEERAELRRGQRAQIRLDAYSYLRYGEIEGRLERIEGVYRDGRPAAYALTVALDDELPFPLHTGLKGSAQIVVFHGTLVQYLRRDEGR